MSDRKGHRSKLAALVIDSNVDLEVAERFWSAALGREVTKRDYPGYRELSSKPTEPMILLQQVDHPSRVHLDIETDNQDAEAARLEKLGAKRVAFVKRWWVMEAPTGQRFCIVNPQRGPLGDDANFWPGEVRASNPRPGGPCLRRSSPMPCRVCRRDSSGPVSCAAPSTARNLRQDSVLRAPVGVDVSCRSIGLELLIRAGSSA